jgi:protein-S-isoprenylcysteine O-methyltransferase Ste14
MMVRLGNFLFHYRNGLFPIAYLVLFWNSPPLFANHLLAASIGLAVALAGQLLRAVTIGLAYIKRGGKDRQVYADSLVQEGVFAHCRNPLYLGNFMIIVGLGFAANSCLFFLVGVPFFALAYWAIIAAEENYLRKKFGKQFDDYCARVNRLAPGFTGLGETLRSMDFKWSRLLVKEYGSTYAWLAGMILLVLKNHWLRYGYTQGRALIWALGSLLIAVTLAYALARYVKKAKIMRAG